MGFESAPGWLTYLEGHSDGSFEDWLKQYRPSKPEFMSSAWISVAASTSGKKQAKKEDLLEEHSQAEIQAAKVAEELAVKVKAIEEDPNIPVRGSKAKGISKKETREKEHAVAAQRLKNIAIDTKVISGKWLFYPKLENVDATWEKIARAIIEEKGALRGKVFAAKVATYQPGVEEGTYVICVYVDDSWDKELVGDVFRTLVKDLGLVSTSYKADIYTIAGIDSKHESKMRSTLYGKKDFMTEEEITAAFEAKKPKTPPAIKKKAKGTGFVDEDEDDSATEEDEPEPKKKKSKK